MKNKLVLVLVILLLAISVGFVAPASASHNPTSGCWFQEHPRYEYGASWYHDGYYWYYAYWWEHWEVCEDGWNDFLGWHQHWEWAGY